MEYLVVDDDRELYKMMYRDLFNQNEYQVKEIPQFVKMNKLKGVIKNIHLNERINQVFNLPLKDIWDKYYYISNMRFDKNKEYCIIFLNGTLRTKFNYEFLKSFKKKHSNVRLAMVLYDSYSNPASHSAYDVLNLFDYKFSFDRNDCKKFGMVHFYSTFSYPEVTFDTYDNEFNAYFIGTGEQRLNILQNILSEIANKVDNCSFTVVGVRKKNQKFASSIKYERIKPYSLVISDVAKSKCIVEILKEGQSGITLRLCEAIILNKKLLTNNYSITEMPFYNEKYTRIIENNQISDEDIAFIKEDIKVDYEYDKYKWFSPLNIVKKIESNNAL